MYYFKLLTDREEEGLKSYSPELLLSLAREQRDFCFALRVFNPFTKTFPSQLVLFILNFPRLFFFFLYFVSFCLRLSVPSTVIEFLR